MAIEKEIEQALDYLTRYPEQHRGLEAVVGAVNDKAVQDLWRNHFDESLLDTPILRRRLYFERDSPTAPWRFVEAKGL